MSWNDFISQTVQDDDVIEAAVAGCDLNQEGLWGATPGGPFSNIQASEIRQLMVDDRGNLFRNGVNLGGVHYTVIRDNLKEDGVNTMDLRAKPTETNSETFNVCVAKSGRVLAFFRGKKHIHGGTLNTKMHGFMAHLKRSGF